MQVFQTFSSWHVCFSICGSQVWHCSEISPVSCTVFFCSDASKFPGNEQEEPDHDRMCCSCCVSAVMSYFMVLGIILEKADFTCIHPKWLETKWLTVAELGITKSQALEYQLSLWWCSYCHFSNLFFLETITFPWYQFEVSTLCSNSIVALPEVRRSNLTW